MALLAWLAALALPAAASTSSEAALPRGDAWSAAAGRGEARLHASVWTVPWDLASASSTECFAELNPFAFAFGPDRRVRVLDAGFLERSRAGRRAGQILIPVVVNDVLRPDGETAELKSAAALEHALGSPERRASHAEELLALATAYDGIELDYERMPEGLWGAYAELAGLLGPELRKRGKRLNLVLEPGPLFGRGGRAAEHWPALARAADSFKLMAYYERGGKDRPGPGNSLEWVRDAAKRTLEVVPADKLVLSLSLAGSIWPLGQDGRPSGRPGRRLHYGQVQAALAASGGKASWDEETFSPFFRGGVGGAPHEVWFEDERSLALKLRAAEALGLRGAAFWYWGGKAPDARALGLCRPRGGAPRP